MKTIGTYENVIAATATLSADASPLDMLLALGNAGIDGAAMSVAPTAKLVAEHEKCRKCNGRGRIDHYRHIQNGVCFACDGSGKDGYARA